MSLKNNGSMAYTVCHAPIQITSYICHYGNYDVTLMCKTFDNSVVAMVCYDVTDVEALATVSNH